LIEINQENGIRFGVLHQALRKDRPP